MSKSPKTEIFPMMLPLGSQAATLYRVSLPPALKQKLIQLESQSNPKFKPHLNYRLPFDPLQKMLERYLGVLVVNSVSANSDDTNWLIAIDHIEEHLLAELMKLWIKAFYILEIEPGYWRGNSAAVQAFAQEVLEQISDDTFICLRDAAETQLFRNGLAVGGGLGFSVMPMIAVNVLRGTMLQLESRNAALWACGTRRLITQPDIITDQSGTYLSSLLLHLSVQTIPSTQKAFLNLELSKVRWVSTPPLKEKIWVPNDKTAYLFVDRFQFQIISGGYRHGNFEWDTRDSIWYQNCLSGQALPAMDDVLHHPESYQLDTEVPIYIPIDTQMKNIEHAQKAGVSHADRKAVIEQVSSIILPGQPVPEIAAAHVCGGNRGRIDTFFDEKSFLRHEESKFPAALNCALRGRPLSIEIWHSGADAGAAETANALMKMLENHMAGLDVRLSMQELGLLGTPLTVDTANPTSKSGAFKRIREIEQNLQNANDPCLCFIVLKGQEYFTNHARDQKTEYDLKKQPRVDPKQVLRLGFARRGRLTQFVTPEGFLAANEKLEQKIQRDPEAQKRYNEKLAQWEAGGRVGRKPQKPSSNFINSVVKSSILDGYRQLGIMADLHTLKRASKEMFVGITVKNKASSIYGQNFRPFPIVVILDGPNNCLNVYCDLISDHLMPYDVFLLALAQRFSEAPATSDDILYSATKVTNFLKAFFAQHRASIVLENNKIIRNCIKNISNNSINQENQTKPSFSFQWANGRDVIPLTLEGAKLRSVIRLRTSTNYEVPDYYTTENGKGFAASSGVFCYEGTYYSLDSRAQHDAITLRQGVSITNSDEQLSHRRLVELYPLYLGESKVEECLEDIHSLRQATIQFQQQRTQLPLPLCVVDKDALDEYCI